MIKGTLRRTADRDARFWSKVTKDPGGCWNWTGALSASGYGVLQRGRRGGGLVRAHRLSYELHRGPIPDGALVLHSCNNKVCVNPDHLSAGDHSENITQAWADGLRPKPGRRLAALKEKLTPADVREIRSMRAAGAIYRDIAARFGITISSAHAAATGKTWRHVPGAHRAHRTN